MRNQAHRVEPSFRRRDLAAALLCGALIVIALWASTIFGWVAFGTMR